MVSDAGVFDRSWTWSVMQVCLTVAGRGQCGQ